MTSYKADQGGHREVFGYHLPCHVPFIHRPYSFVEGGKEELFANVIKTRKPKFNLLFHSLCTIFVARNPNPCNDANLIDELFGAKFGVNDKHEEDVTNKAWNIIISYGIYV